MPVALKHIRDQLLPGLTGIRSTYNPIGQWEELFADTPPWERPAAPTFTLDEIHQAEQLIAELQRDKA